MLGAFKSRPFPDFPVRASREQHVVLSQLTKMDAIEATRIEDGLGKKSSSPAAADETDHKQSGVMPGGKIMVAGGPGRKSKACKFQRQTLTITTAN